MRCWHHQCGVCGADFTGSHQWVAPTDWAAGVWLCYKCGLNEKGFVVEKIFTIEKKDDNNDKGNNNDKGGGSEGYNNDVVMAT